MVDKRRYATHLSQRPELADLWIADPPEVWAALGFAVDDATVVLNGVTIHLNTPGHGITAWAIRNGQDPAPDIDGLASRPPTLPQPPFSEQPQPHPNTATAIDHVVVTTADFDRTAEALTQAGMPLSRIRQLDTFRQGFRRLGPAILELVETSEAPKTSFWGLVIIVEDLDALAQRLGDHLGKIRPAVQPGRHIATLKASAGLGAKVAFMDPEPVDDGAA